MFKNFLTYEWAIRFQSQIQAQSGLSITRKDRALKSSTLLLHHLTRALGSTNNKDIARHYCVSVMCLRDAWEEIAAEKSELLASQEIIVSDGVNSCETGSRIDWIVALQGVYLTLEHRLIELTEKASSAEQGQFRMLG